MGFLLLQKYCMCTTDKAPVCCPEGWRLIFAGSRFCIDTERRYAPIEGEAAAIAWALDKCRLFVMGCPNLIVVTDHEPLKGLFGDRDLSKISNPWLFKLKEKTLRYRFTIQHCPGKWHKASDVVSHNPPVILQALLNGFPTEPSQLDIIESDVMDDWVKSTTLLSSFRASDNVALISPDVIRAAGHNDLQYKKLIETIQNGFEKTRSLTVPEIREYWEVRHRLSVDDGLVLLDHRIVIPTSQSANVLRSLHSAHQGEVGMKARANRSVYWPGMNAPIRNTRASCMFCAKIAPRQTKEPINRTQSPDWQIVIDLFYVRNHRYLACTDRLTGWLIRYHLSHGQANASRLISICRDIFQRNGAPEELSSDGGPPFTSLPFTQFLRDWAVKHRLSSAAYPQSNGRAELAVKSANRFISGNTGAQGSLDNDRTARAILQHRNTPIQNFGLFRAQLLLHHRLHDFIPSQPTLYKPHSDWIAAAKNRKIILSRRNARLIEQYNKTTPTLCSLQKGQIVTIQRPTTRRWDTTSQVVETLPNHQYRVRVNGSGRITLRNRRFLRKLETPTSPPPIPSAAPETSTSNPNPTPLKPNTPVLQTMGTGITSNTAQPSSMMQTKTPRALSRLLPHNQPGLKELIPPKDLYPRVMGGRRCRITITHTSVKRPAGR